MLEAHLEAATKQYVTAREGILDWIERHAGPDGWARGHHCEIGRALGLCRETITREIARLEMDCWIERIASRGTIPQSYRLCRRAER